MAVLVGVASCIRFSGGGDDAVAAEAAAVLGAAVGVANAALLLLLLGSERRARVGRLVDGSSWLSPPPRPNDERRAGTS